MFIFMYALKKKNKLHWLLKINLYFEKKIDKFYENLL